MKHFHGKMWVMLSPRERERDEVLETGDILSRVRQRFKRGRQLRSIERVNRAPSPGGEGWGEGGR